MHSGLLAVAGWTGRRGEGYEKTEGREGKQLAQPAGVQGTSAQTCLASVQYISCTQIHQVSESQILCPWLLSWTIVCGALNVQGLCFPMMNAVSLRDGRNC